MSLSGSYNLQVLRGLSTNRSLLSCNGDGTTVDLWPSDDDSGRQEWEITPVANRQGIYNITVVGGVSSNRLYLSANADGTTVDLWPSDDGSGRQRWVFTPVSGSSICSYYNIEVEAGVTGGRIWLSCNADGTTVDLWNEDDGSGRQRWQLQPLG